MPPSVFCHFSRARFVSALIAGFSLFSVLAHANEAASAPSVDDIASVKVGAVWDYELSGKPEEELKSAKELIASTTVEWAKQWASGVVHRLTSLNQTVALEFTAIDGRRCDTKEMKGKVILVDFWATWCPPCVEAMRKLKQTYARYHAKGLEVLGVSWDNDKAKVLGYIKANTLEWPQYYDGTKPGRWGNTFGVGGVPYTLLIDKAGHLRAFSAYSESTSLEAEIEKLLNE